MTILSSERHARGPVAANAPRWSAGSLLVAVLAAGSAWLAPPATAADSVAAPPAGTEAALILLETHCVRCHGGESTKGGLNLLTREALLAGGDAGGAVAPGNPGDSLLIRSVRHEADPPMPQKARKLSDDAIARLADWVRAGAPYPRPLNKAGPTTAPARSEFAVTAADRAHWAFRPVTRPAVPGLSTGGVATPGAKPPSGDPALSDHPIDRFILVGLRENKLTLSPEADRRTLIRRVTFDLTGLPPTPAEVDAFVADAAAGAYERLVDRLLASPAYGERWGRHWLDLARFAETDGFEHDAVRPHAWRYRDYVVRSFNADKPYDRFVREQLAGDELWPDDPDAVTATGFNLLGPDMVDSADQVQRRHNALNDMTDTAGLAFLGLTMGCARCHDHKFEPISQKDYYALQACFQPAAFVRDQTVATPADRAAHEAATARYGRQPAVRELAELESPVRAKLVAAKLKKLSPEAQAAHAAPPDRRTTEQANLVLETEDKLKVTEKELAAAFAGPAAGRRKELAEAVRKLPKPLPLPQAMALSAGNGPPAKTFVLHRGEYTQPTEEVGPGAPAVLVSKDEGGGMKDEGEAGNALPGSSSSFRLHPSSSDSRRRAALADWVASAANPLTARVMVNRIWRHHFGRGIVATPSDFGTHGAKPTHPELLDWLAGEFVAHGWSIKRMHRLMLTSAAYRQQASPPADVAAAGRRVDPDNRLYWRMNRLRLEGEAIRDALLAIGGTLNPQAGGPGVFPPIPEDALKGVSGWKASRDPADHARRSVYIFARRNLRFPFLEVFDAPDNNLSCPGRERSTTAPQALTLLNADEVTAAAAATAKRLEAEAKSPNERVALAYRLALGRPPREPEAEAARQFLAGGAPLAELCRALFNLNEFVYLE